MKRNAAVLIAGSGSVGSPQKGHGTQCYMPCHGDTCIRDTKRWVMLGEEAEKGGFEKGGYDDNSQSGTRTLANSRKAGILEGNTTRLSGALH